MTNKELLDFLIQLGYSDDYICMCFLFMDESDKIWFLNLISTDKKYKYLGKAITSDMVDIFLESMNDTTVNLKKYFQRKHIINRANCHQYRKHRIETYSKIMGVDLDVAYYLYLEHPKECEKDMFDTDMKRLYGDDWREKYPRRKRHKLDAWYFDEKTGTLKSIRDSKYNKMYYMYGEGWRYK